jgi:hypothetical protein
VSEANKKKRTKRRKKKDDNCDQSFFPSRHSDTEPETLLGKSLQHLTPLFSIKNRIADREQDMANGQSFQHRRVTFIAFVLVLAYFSEIVKAQQNWFRSTATTRRTTTTTSSKIKRHPEARNSATVVFPQGIILSF